MDVLLNAKQAFQDALTKVSGCDTLQQLLTAAKGIVALSDGDFSDVLNTGKTIFGLFGGDPPQLPGIIQEMPTISYQPGQSMNAIGQTWTSLQPILNPPSGPAPDAGKMAITLEEFNG